MRIGSAKYRAGRWLIAVCAILLLAGCATQTRRLLQERPSGLPERAELSSIPFHPQERYQCGPASLAMALNASGVQATPDALVPQVYVPAREGSLQPEMLASARRNGAFSMTVPPTMPALLEEVAAGHPVIVLQNLSLSLFPLWHYAVVIGYDLAQAEVILRSGTTERLVMPISTFEHTWKRGGYWGMVALPAGQLPATADEAQAVNALVAFEKTAHPALARKAYESALQRWPRNFAVHLGAGNAAYASGDRQAAASILKRATQQFPDHAAGFNNLATVLLELGELEQARIAAEQAVALDGPWRDDALATLHAVRSAQSRASH